MPVMAHLELPHVVADQVLADGEGARHGFRVIARSGCSDPSDDYRCLVPATFLVTGKDGHVEQRVDLGEVSADVPEVHIADFDLDGREDVAIHHDDSGPYGSPTYEVFLATGPHAEPFRRSPFLSTLTRDNLGMFEIDAKHRRLTTGSKSGCCWHSSVTYTIRRGFFILVETLEEDGTRGDDLLHYTRRFLRGGSWHRVQWTKPLDDE